MPLDKEALRMVVFIIGDDYDTRTQQVLRRPVGTGFFVSLYSSNKSIPEHRYIVTAKHTVISQKETAIRITTQRGAVLEDIPVVDWIVDDDSDLAVIPFSRQSWDEPYLVNVRLSGNNLPYDRLYKFKLGDPVYFLGLLMGIAEMGRQNIPMVRSGTIGAMYQNEILLKNGTRTTAHLIDCRSYGGFSGSPCFLQWTEWTDRASRDKSSGGPLKRHEKELFLGMLIGHFDDYERQQGKPLIAINVGVGVVLPAETIYRFLTSQEELIALRKEREDSGPEPSAQE